MLKRADMPSPPLQGRSVHDELKIAWEPFEKVIEEALPLLRRHYEELGLPDPFDPDWRSLFWLASRKRLRVAIVRHNGRIVGYIAGLWSNYLASKDQQVVMVNAIYLEPSYRGSLKLFGRMLDMMIEFADEVNCHRLEAANQGVHKHRINKLLVRYGWRRSDEPAYRLDV